MGLLAAYQIDDIATVKSNLHTLKGSAGTIGVMRVADIAQRAEGKLKTNDTSSLSLDLPAIKVEFEVFLEQYQSIIERFRRLNRIFVTSKVANRLKSILCKHMTIINLYYLQIDNLLTVKPMRF